MPGECLFFFLFFSSRTSSILSKDHPPDKKPKSDKTSLPSNEFDPTGNFLLLFSGSYSLFLFKKMFMSFLSILSLSLYASLSLSLSLSLTNTVS